MRGGLLSVLSLDSQPELDHSSHFGTVRSDGYEYHAITRLERGGSVLSCCGCFVSPFQLHTHTHTHTHTRISTAVDIHANIVPTKYLEVVVSAAYLIYEREREALLLSTYTQYTIRTIYTIYIHVCTPHSTAHTHPQSQFNYLPSWDPKSPSLRPSLRASHPNPISE